jgi:hypothetical protein
MKTNIFLAHARRRVPDRVLTKATSARPGQFVVPIRPAIAGGRLVCRWQQDETTGRLGCCGSLEDGTTDVDASPRTEWRLRTAIYRAIHDSFESGCRKAA